MELNEFATLLNRANSPTDYLARSGFGRRYTQTSGSAYLRDPGYGKKIAHESVGNLPQSGTPSSSVPTFRAGVNRNYDRPWGGDMSFSGSSSTGRGSQVDAGSAGEMLGKAISGYRTQRKRQKEQKAQQAASQAALAQQRAREHYVSTLPIAPMDFAQMVEPGPSMAPAPTYPMGWESGPSPAPMDFAQMVEPGPSMAPAPTSPMGWESGPNPAPMDFAQMVEPGPYMGGVPTLDDGGEIYQWGSYNTPSAPTPASAPTYTPASAPSVSASPSQSQGPSQQPSRGRGYSDLAALHNELSQADEPFGIPEPSFMNERASSQQSPATGTQSSTGNAYSDLRGDLSQEDNSFDIPEPSFIRELRSSEPLETPTSERKASRDPSVTSPRAMRPFTVASRALPTETLPRVSRALPTETLARASAPLRRAARVLPTGAPGEAMQSPNRPSPSGAFPRENRPSPSGRFPLEDRPSRSGRFEQTGRYGGYTQQTVESNPEVVKPLPRASGPLPRSPKNTGPLPRSSGPLPRPPKGTGPLPRGL